MKLAYADPPYLGCSKFYDHPDAAKWDDVLAHAVLLNELDTNYDGWAYSLSSTTLQEILVHAPAGVRIASWVLVGVCMVGRPVARHFDDGLTLEVNRTCIEGSVPNANSMLYGAAWRAAKAMGYRRLITYTQADESGASLRAAGWRVVAERSARKSWADSTADRQLAAMRDPVGNGGVQRTLWEAS